MSAFLSFVHLATISAIAVSFCHRDRERGGLLIYGLQYGLRRCETKEQRAKEQRTSDQQKSVET